MECSARLDSPPQKETNTSVWSPSCDSSSDSESEDSGIQALNKAIKELSDLTSMDTPEPVTFQLEKDWESATRTEKSECISKATHACKVICNVIAPNAADELFRSLLSGEQVSQELITLMKAYASAPTRNLRTQILSIYAFEYPVKKLQELHEPFIKVSKWQIKKARNHAKIHGPGIDVKNLPKHRISLDMTKVDHFVDFTNRPYFHQDVAFGVRKVKLGSGETFEIPNVIRTVTRSTMVNQYLKYCSDDSFEPLSRATLFRILQVREASGRKSLAGLDNTAADGASAVQALVSIVNGMVSFGAEKSWAINVEKRLLAGKQYLRTDFKVHCNEDISPCADHCRMYALSDPVDKDLQEQCSHVHNVICDQCQDIRDVIDEIETKIKNVSHPTLTEEHRGDILFDFNEAKKRLFNWKNHIIRSVNQDFAKQDALRDLDSTSVLLIMDWAMKFLQLKYREKQSDWYGQKGMSWHVSSAVSRKPGSDELLVTSYVHLFDSSSQDWF